MDTGSSLVCNGGGGGSSCGVDSDAALLDARLFALDAIGIVSPVVALGFSWDDDDAVFSAGLEYLAGVGILVFLGIEPLDGSFGSALLASLLDVVLSPMVLSLDVV